MPSASAVPRLVPEVCHPERTGARPDRVPADATTASGGHGVRADRDDAVERVGVVDRAPAAPRASLAWHASSAARRHRRRVGHWRQWPGRRAPPGLAARFRNGCRVGRRARRRLFRGTTGQGTAALAGRGPRPAGRIVARGSCRPRRLGNRHPGRRSTRLGIEPTHREPVRGAGRDRAGIDLHRRPGRAGSAEDRARRDRPARGAVGHSRHSSCAARCSSNRPTAAPTPNASRRCGPSSELSRLYEDLIGEVPLGKQLFTGANPVRTGGPMQVGDRLRRASRERTAVSVRSARLDPARGVHAPRRPVLRHRPSARLPGVVRPAPVSLRRLQRRLVCEPQRRVPGGRGRGLGHRRSTLDGDLIVPDGSRGQVGATEAAVRSLGPQLGIGDAAIRRALEQGDRQAFERTELYTRVFALAERKSRRPLPRAVDPADRPAAARRSPASSPPSGSPIASSSATSVVSARRRLPAVIRDWPDRRGG